jgi:hypothetical protein
VRAAVRFSLQMGVSHMCCGVFSCQRVGSFSAGHFRHAQKAS